MGSNEPVKCVIVSAARALEGDEDVVINILMLVVVLGNGALVVWLRRNCSVFGLDFNTPPCPEFEIMGSPENGSQRNSPTFYLFPRDHFTQHTVLVRGFPSVTSGIDRQPFQDILSAPPVGLSDLNGDQSALSSFGSNL
jgi:hypothetical protein